MSNAGALAWEGKEEALSRWLDKKEPSAYGVGDLIKNAVVKNSESRDGVAFKVSTLKAGERNFSFFGAWKVSMETNIMADEAADRATTAVQKLKAITEAFRANTKNDISSMKAASERVQHEVTSMCDKYKQAMALLNSPEFSKAVEQAERMSTALQSISALSETKLSVAVFSGGALGGEK